MGIGKYRLDDEMFNPEEHVRNTLGTFIKEQIQVLAKGRYAIVLEQDRLRLKDENVFINLKCSFLFHFLSKY